MKVEISLHRCRPKVGGGIDVVNYDVPFMQRLEAYVEAEEKPWQDSDLKVLHKAVKDLSGVIERVCPAEGEKPFQIVIDVTGEVDNSPGPRLY